MANPLLSVIMPVSRIGLEALPSVLVDLDRNLSKAEYSSEVLVLSLTSSAELSDLIAKMNKSIKNLKLIESDPGSSLGSAIRQAILLSNGNIRLLAMTGRSIPVDQLNLMIPHFKKGADIVICARNFEGQNQISSWLNYKIALEKTARFATRFFLKGVSDPFSDFIAFTQEATNKIFDDLKLGDTLLNFWILKSAKEKGCRIEEANVFVS